MECQEQFWALRNDERQQTTDKPVISLQKATRTWTAELARVTQGRQGRAGLPGKVTMEQTGRKGLKGLGATGRGAAAETPQQVCCPISETQRALSLSLGKVGTGCVGPSGPLQGSPQPVSLPLCWFWAKTCLQPLMELKNPVLGTPGQFWES